MNGSELFPIVGASSGWNALFGLGDGVSAIFVLPLAFVSFFFVVLFPAYFLLGFAERKLAADLQARVGPNRTAFNGALQVVADTIKLAAKRVVRGESRPDPRWTAIRNAVLYSSFAFAPFGTALVFLDSEVGAFLPIACLAAASLCSLFSNEGSFDLENEIAAHRRSFLWISAWVPATIAITAAVARAGSAKWSIVLSRQSHGPLHWTALSSPFEFVAFFVFLLSGLVGLQLPPFHSLDRGARHRAGAELGLFGLNGFYSGFLWCLVATGLFLGGQPIRDPAEVPFAAAIFQLFSSVAKAGITLVVLRVVAKALPQLRQDQMTEFCWRILTPVGALCLVGELVWLGIFSGGGS